VSTVLGEGQPGYLTLGNVGLLNGAALASVHDASLGGPFEGKERQCCNSAAGLAASSGVNVASALSGSRQAAVFLSLACARLNSC
jgi:hypothetical protein